jgi:transglutaminase-like putative cysteine protease
MRSSLIESRPAPVANGYRPQSAFRPQRPLTPPPVASQSPAQSFALAPAEGWLPLLLLAVAVYSVVYSVTIAITISHTGILWITTAFGLLGGLLVAKSKRFPQALLHIAACILGYWLALCTTSYLAYHVSLMTILSNLHAVISNGLALTGTPESSMIFLFYLAFLCFFLGYFGAWLVYRAHLPWLVGVVYTSIMLVNLNYIGRANLSWLIVLLIGALILLIARVQLANQLSVWKNEGLYTDPVWLRALTSRFLSIASLFILLILPFSWFLPIAGEPAAGANFWNNLGNAWTNITHANFSVLTNPGSLFNSSDPAANFFSNQLTITGSVNLPAGQVLSYITGSDTRGEYLEGFTFDTFDGHTWTTRTEGVKTPYPANASLPQDNREASYNQLVTTVTILQPPGGTEHFIFGPAEPGSFSVPVTLLTDNTGDFTSAWTQTDPLRPNETYQVTSDISAATPQDLSSIPFPIDQSNIWPSDPNEQTLQRYDLQIPKSISSEVRATANLWTKGAPTMYDAVMALQNHLTDPNTFTYSLNNPSVPANTDAVTWLLHTHSGYCTYYATAMTIMARELGIPARVVNGFSEGRYDTQQKAWVVDGSQAHSWVQVYFPNFGWINFDPTPGFSVKNATSPTNTVAPGATKTPTTGTANPNKHKQPDPQATTTTNQHNSAASPIGGSFAGQNLFLTFSLLILLGSLVIFGLAIARYRGTRGQLAPAASVYARLCRVARLFGSPPESWQTPYEYTFALSKRFPQAANALHRLADLFVRERWSKPQPVVAQHETQELNTLWQQLRNTLLRSPFTKKH